MADQLTTLAAIKSRLSISDTADDVLLGTLNDQVSGWIEGYTGRKFVPETAVTYTFDTSAGYVLRIPRGIRSISAMGIASMTNQPDSGGTYTAVTLPGSVLLRPRAQDLPEGWPATEVWLSRATNSTPLYGTIQNGVTITGNFGFAATPPEIEAVTLDAIASAYSVRRMGASGVIGADDTAVVPWVRFFSHGSPQRGTLDRYRYFGIG